MDNIIEFLNFEDDGLEVLDQKVKDGLQLILIVNQRRWNARIQHAGIS